MSMELDVNSLVGAIDAYILKSDKDLEDQLSAEGFVEARTAVECVATIEDGITEAVTNHVDHILDQLAGCDNIADFFERLWPDTCSEEELVKALYDLVFAEFQNMMNNCTVAWIMSTDAELAEAIEPILSNPTVGFIHGWSQQLANIMNLRTKDDIEKILLDAQKNALSIDDVSEMIADSGIREYGYRSRSVALTEVLRVEEYSHQEARVQNPSCYAKKWRHVLSVHPRENHMAMDGQQVFKREAFTLVGRDGATYHPQCPRDTCLPAGESINCHCITDDVVDKEILGMSLEERLSIRQKCIDEVNAEYAEFEIWFKNEYGDDVEWTEYNRIYEEWRNGNA